MIISHYRDPKSDLHVQWAETVTDVNQKNVHKGSKGSEVETRD